MSDTEHLRHLMEIEAAATNAGLKTRRHEVKSVVIIQVEEPNGEWAWFDPIRQGKDVAKLLYASVKKSGWKMSEPEFRRKIVEEVINHDFSLS